MFEPESRMFDVGYDDYMDGCIFPPKNCTKREIEFWRKGYNQARIDCIKGSIGLLIIMTVVLTLAFTVVYYCAKG
jgi:hypothetical protein